MSDDGLNVEPTVEIILKMATTLDDRADELRRLAEDIRERNDLTLASEAVNIICNMGINLRLDLMVTRPLREYQRALILTKEQS